MNRKLHLVRELLLGNLKKIKLQSIENARRDANFYMENAANARAEGDDFIAREWTLAADATRSDVDRLYKELEELDNGKLPAIYEDYEEGAEATQPVC